MVYKEKILLLYFIPPSATVIECVFLLYIAYV